MMLAALQLHLEIQAPNLVHKKSEFLQISSKFISEISSAFTLPLKYLNLSSSSKFRS
jgi:hypothetical protein